MSENVTLETIVDDDEAIFDEGYDHSEEMARFIRTILQNFELYYNALIIVIGIPSNILALLLLVRRRLWHQHEAYVYVAAILFINIIEMVIYHSNRWIEQMNRRFLRFPTIDDITCKVWVWAGHMIICLNWLHVLMLLNVYLRQQLKTSNDMIGCFLNLAAKYCSLLGTKVTVISFFTSCTVAFFFNFAISNLRVFGEFRYCTVTASLSYINRKQYQLFMQSIFWLGADVPILVEVLLILLIAWKKKRSSGFVFSQMDGVSQDNGDVEAMTKMFLCCAVVFLALRVPLSLAHAMHTLNNASYTYNSLFRVAFRVLVLITASSPLSTPIVCFTVRSRFRDELRTMVVGCCRRRCCPATGRHGMSYQEAADSGSSVVQMDPIHEDLKITETEESLDLPVRRDLNYESSVTQKIADI